MSCLAATRYIGVESNKIETPADRTELFYRTRPALSFSSRRVRDE